MSAQATPTPSESVRLDSRTSRTLFARAQRGDAEALGALLGRVLPAIRRWARGRLPGWARGASNTSDLIQDAVLGTVRRLDTVELHGRDALAAYLMTAVRNKIRDEHRRVAVRGGVAASIDHLELVDPAPSPFDATAAAEETRRYQTALASLSPPDRELIVGHVELGYTHAQLGCMSGRTANAARMALARALRRLAERMGDA